MNGITILETTSPNGKKITIKKDFGDYTIRVEKGNKIIKEYTTSNLDKVLDMYEVEFKEQA